MTTFPAIPGINQSEPAPDPQPGLADAAASPSDPDRDGEVDVLYLAGQRMPAESTWLLATDVDGMPGGEFTAQGLTDAGPSAFGGDVVVLLAANDPAEGQPPPAVRIHVYAAMVGRLIPVAAWRGHDVDGWPERIRPYVAITMRVLTELEEHGADLGARDRVDLGQAAAAEEAAGGFPPRLTFPADPAPLVP